MSINMTNIGNMTNTQDTIEAPDLQIKFNTHVQKMTYRSLTKKINVVLDVAHE